MESDTKMVLDQLEKDSNDIMNLLKKERAERERDSNLIKERIDNEKKELQVGYKETSWTVIFSPKNCCSCLKATKLIFFFNIFFIVFGFFI